MAIHSLSFAEAAQPLPNTLDAEHADTLFSLAQRGFEVRHGLTAFYAGSIGIMALQPHIHEALPKDASDSRFASERSTAEWQGRDGGRNMFLLLKYRGNNKRLVGYGWTGPEISEQLPDGDTTFAARLGTEALGKQLELPFTELIIASSRKMFKAKNFWLETWASNKPAVEAYQKAGFKIVHEAKAARGRLMQARSIDTRLHMFLS